MPRGDGTGPSGMGPMTGRAMGYCAGFGVPGYMNGPAGMGRGMGRGGGRGFGRGFRRAWAVPAAPYPVTPPAAAQGAVQFSPQFAGQQAGEIEMLKAQADQLTRSLDMINERIDALSAGASDETE